MKTYLRVSEILARLQSFPKDEEALARRDAKGLIGTNVHKAILDDAEGLFPLLETEREAAYFGSYLIWKKKERPAFKMQVPRLYCHELMITGEIDGLVQGAMRHPYLIDWKCSYKPDPEIWNMQAHFYWYLLKVNGLDICDNMKWVNLRHKKWVEEGPLGEKIERYSPLAPVFVDFFYNEQTLSQCIQEANKAWEEKRNELIADF